MRFIPLSDNAARQAIDANAIFREWLRSSAEAKRYAGGMYFKQQQGYEYLVKTSPDNRQQRLGARSPETESIYAAFVEGKTKTEARSKSLRKALTETERVNKALQVGRAPNLVVDLLNEMERAGLGSFFTVVGTHALYAYEAAASVRIEAGAMATQDVDLLWDARKSVQFVGAMERLDSSMLKILQRVDASFVRKEGQLETAINDKGFMVDFLRRIAVDNDPHPYRFSEDEDDMWPVQALRAAEFLNAPRFEQPIISTTGRMAMMRTIDPKVFVEFKQWMATLDNREAAKRRRDSLQASIVQELTDDGHLRVAS